MMFNAWPEGGRGRTLAERRRKAHSVAARIGWSYRKDRKKTPRGVMEYLDATGLSTRALKAYRAARKTPVERLLAKRVARKRRTGAPIRSFIRTPFLVNDPRHAYREFVARYIRRIRPRSPAEARAAMIRAARAWKSGRVAANELPGVVYYDDNPLYRDPRGRFVGRPVPGAVPLTRLPGRYGGWKNPLYRDPRGRFVGHRVPGAVRLRRLPGRYGGWRNPDFDDNPVLPTMAWDDNRRRGRRRVRRMLFDDNPVLPYSAFNYESEDNPIAALGDALETTFSVDFWTDTLLPMGAGFIGGQFVGGLVYGLAEKVLGETVKGSGFVPSLARVGSRALGGAAVSALAFFVTKDRDVAEKALAGSLVAVLAGIIQEIFGMETYKKITGMEGIEDVAADLTEELKKRIAESVRGEIRAAEAGVTGSPGVSAFVTTQDLAPAPTLGPGPRVGDMGAFVTAEEMQTAPVSAQYGAPAGGPPVVADLSTFSDAFADMMLV